MRTGRTRLPLVKPNSDLDNAIGVINAKDLLPAALGQTIDLRARARTLPRIAEGTRVDEILRDMRRHQRHLALVVDEHGTVLALEDILEELVGEIDDEFDTAAEQLIQHQDGELRIDGSAPVRLVARELGLTLDAPHETTLNGHLIEQLGRVPHSGETVQLYGARLEVIAGDDTQVRQLAVRRAPRATDPSSDRGSPHGLRDQRRGVKPVGVRSRRSAPTTRNAIRSVPLSLGEAAEGDQPHERHHEPQQEAPHDHHDDPDDD